MTDSLGSGTSRCGVLFAICQRLFALVKRRYWWPDGPSSPCRRFVSVFKKKRVDESDRTIVRRVYRFTKAFCQHSVTRSDLVSCPVVLNSVLRSALIKLYFIIENAFVGGEDLPHVANELVLVKVTMRNCEQRLGKVAPALGHQAPAQPLHPVARVFAFGLVPLASRRNADAYAHSVLRVFSQRLTDAAQQR